MRHPTAVGNTLGRIEVGEEGGRGERRMFTQLFPRARGQSLVEYTLLFALIFLVVIGTVIIFGPALGSEFSNIKSQL